RLGRFKGVSVSETFRKRKRGGPRRFLATEVCTYEVDTAPLRAPGTRYETYPVWVRPGYVPGNAQDKARQVWLWLGTSADVSGR
ncbi:hypothetical protein KI387_014385, partial [Taxus chinensis]